MLNKRLLALLLALVMTIGFVLSASSCMYAVDILTGEDGASSGGTDRDNVDSENEDDGDYGKNPPASSTGGNNEGSATGSNSNQVFYPGTNNPDNIDDISPEMRTLLSTVNVNVSFDVSAYPYYSGTTKLTSSGSGIIYKLDREAGDAYIITNFHVVFNSGEINAGGFSDTINVSLYGMEHSQYTIPAKVIGGSMNYDIAVLKIEGSEVLKNSMATEAVIADSDKVRAFDKVYVIGNAEGYGISATNGIISVESEKLTMVGADGRSAISVRVMRTSAAINEGNSGGGLYSADGKLIGIVNAKRTEDGVDNMGYAIPTNLAIKLAENILRNCDGENNTSVKKCLIGINLATASSGLVTDGDDNLVIVEKVAIDTVEANCATDELKDGDIINSITIDGNKTVVTRMYHITDNMFDAKVGSVVVLNITRGDQTFDVTVTLPESALTIVK